MAKIILTHEVTGLGTSGDIVEVKNGYARNYLVPQGLAITWSKGAEKQAESIRAAREARNVHDLEAAKQISASLQSTPVTIQVKAGQGGRLFGSVKVSDVADAIAEAGIGQVDKRKVEILQPVKSTGTFQASVRLHDEISSTFDFQVVAGK